MIDSPIEEIKNRLDIVEVISSYIKLQKAGANYRAPCPFHSEKKPSFFVSPARQIWHCFGCGKGGSIFNFVMEIEGVEFGDALRILAKKAGVELTRQDPKLKTQKQRFYEICDLAARFFEKQLEETDSGKKAKKYLLGRGIKQESFEKWRVGYAPNIWQGLSDFLVGKGYSREEAVKAGLAVKKEGGLNFENQDSNFQAYDRFRGRIMFPVFDLSSQVIGFGGRVFGEESKEEIAKYLNTPNTLLYDKSRVLYGLDKARVEIRKKGACILVEGYTDVIMSSQAGVGNVVATSGTALTPFQLTLLKRYSENLVTAFDMDVAGNSATKRGIDLAQVQGFNIRVVVMPQGKDPADVAAGSPKKWEELVKKTKSILDFYFETTFQKCDSKTPEGKKEISKILLPSIKKIPNRIEQGYWIDKLSRSLEVKAEYIEEELQKTSKDQRYSTYHGAEKEKPSLKIESAPKNRKDLLEQKIVNLLLKNPQDIEAISKDLIKDFSPSAKEILLLIKKYPKSKSKDILAKIQTSEESADFLNYLLFKTDLAEEQEDDIDSQEEFQFCLHEFQLFGIKSKLDRIALAIRKAEGEENSKKAGDLTKEFNEIAKRLTKNF